VDTPIDHSSRDADAKVTFYVPLWKRRGITQEQFDDYWRDVHGPVCARLPGQFQYWQWHVAHNAGGIFPAIEKVNLSSTDEEQFDGIAELTFLSAADRQIWFDAAAILMDDEHNIFSKAIGYVTEPGNSKTYVDRIEVGNPNGNQQGVIKYHVQLRQSETVSTSEFRQHLTETFAPLVARSEHVSKFRLHLFEPPNTSRPDAAGVSHSEPANRLYQAAYEIAFQSGLDRETFFASEAYKQATKDHGWYVRQITPFPERAGYTFVYNGKMTLAGQRGSRTAELITDIGATNQVREDIMKLMGIREPAR
jgi:hypothetical protein